MDALPKVLVSCPTAKVKNYCFEKWLENVMSFTYPNFDVIMFDNTPDRGENAKALNRIYKSNYGFNKERKFKVINSLEKHKINKTLGIIERMTLSHNDCRIEAIANEYDYLLHLESDVFPPHDVIERLLQSKKSVVNGLYYSDEGVYRRPMVQLHLEVAPNYGSSFYLNYKNELQYFKGQLLQVAHAGLGCTLIKTWVLKRINFRFEKGVDMHPDTFFAEDCQRLNIPNFLDTSLICEHQNKNWGIYGIDYN